MSTHPRDPAGRSAPDPPVPDTKDWTWTLLRACPECGFDATAFDRGAIAAMVREAVSRFPDVLGRPDATTRPDPGTWSALEYGCHVRDVCRVFAERLDLMQREQEPHFPNWDQDASAVSDRYWAQDPTRVAAEVRESGEAVAQAFSRVGEDQWQRTGVRSNGSQFTIETLGRYLLHDLFHHVRDVGG